MGVAILMPAYNEAGRLARRSRPSAPARRPRRGRRDGLPRRRRERAARSTPATLPAPEPDVPHRPRAPRGEPRARARRSRRRASSRSATRRVRRLRDDGRRRPAPHRRRARARARDRGRGRRRVRQPLPRRLATSRRARRALLRAARVFERALTGLRLADAHNGLRAFSRARARAGRPSARIGWRTRPRSSSSVSRAGALRIVEVPVSVRYTARRSRRGRASLGAVRHPARSGARVPLRRDRSEPRRRSRSSRSSSACSSTTGRRCAERTGARCSLEAVVFVGGAFFIAFPNGATTLAHVGRHRTRRRFPPLPASSSGSCASRS